jgi:glycosyltransferase involved in cell wall biosynthesis
MRPSSGRPLDVVIVVVAFNEEERIGDCLRALLDQVTDQNYAVTVVDDGSSDNTAAVVEELQESDARLLLIRHGVNLGRGAARRTGQDSTSAARIAFVDADIIVPNDWLQRCSEALNDFSAVSAVPFPDGDSAVVWRIFRPAIRFRVGFSGVTGNNVVFDASLLRLEPFDSRHRLGEDFRLSHRLLRSGYKLKILEDVRVEHRETKPYGAAIKFMWDNGVDATSHPFEFKIIRLPDLSWLFWLMWCLISIAGILIGWWTWMLGTASVIGVTVITSLAFTLSRFLFRPHPFRWLGAAVGCFPLIATYLLGRTWGLVTLLSPRHRRNIGL